jgi:pimeloyl-ACP methyl ester carboxylesterase
MTIPDTAAVPQHGVGRLRSMPVRFAVVVILAACSASPTASPVVPTVSSTPPPSAAASQQVGLTWLYGEFGYQTSVLRVPLDYANPAGEQISIALARRPATDPANRIGTLVFLPGGPGDPGVEQLRTDFEALFTEPVRARFDIVAFDARGRPGGVFEPRVRCPFDDRQPPTTGDPRTGDLEKVVDAAAALAEACEEASGELLSFVGTDSIIQDVDRLREALHEESLSFQAISYGTFTGLHYAERYPDRVRAMILDAPLHPALDLLAWERDAVVTQQAVLDQLLAACAEDPACAFHVGGATRQAFDDLMAGFANGPIDGLSVLEAWAAVGLGLRDPAGLEVALAEAQGGDVDGMRDLADGVGDFDEIGYSLAVLCADQAGPRDVKAYLDLADELRPLAPDFAWTVASGVIACASWAVEGPSVAAPVQLNGVPPILILASTGDPSTPYPWAVALAGELDDASLVTRDGPGHGSAFLGNPCIDEISSTYLVALELPSTPVTCP